MSLKDYSYINSKSNYYVFAGNYIRPFKQELESIKKKYIAENSWDFDFVEIFGDEFDIESFNNTLMSLPMISLQKTIVLKQAYRISKSELKIINERIENAGSSTVILIDYINEEKSYSENVKESQALFKNAKIIKLFKSEYISYKEVENMIEKTGIVLNAESINRIVEITEGNSEKIENLINIAWMINEKSEFEKIINEEILFEISPLMHYDFIKHFQLKNSERSFNLYRNIIKWKIASQDGIVNILLNSIGDLQKMKLEYEEKGENAIEKFLKIGKNNYLYKKIYNEKLKTCRIWSKEEIKNAYIKMYCVLRDMRNMNKEQSKIIFEQSFLECLK